MSGLNAMDKFDHMRLTRKILNKNEEIQEKREILNLIRNAVKYNRMGEVIDNELWKILINEEEYFKIAEDVLKESTITTSWIGINIVKPLKVENDDFIASISPSKPYIFDTEIKDSHNIVRYKYYYPDENVAIKHHQKLVFMAEQKMLKELERI